MSRRFGRNQRRKMRERIADLEGTYRMQEALRDRIRSERDKLSGALAKVERAFGQHFAALDVRTIREFAMASVPPVWNLALEARFDGSFTDRLVSLSVDERCHTIQMWLLHGWAHLDEMRNQVHLRIEYAGANEPRAAYFISKEALVNMYPDDLARRIAPILAKALLSQVACAMQQKVRRNTPYRQTRIDGD